MPARPLDDVTLIDFSGAAAAPYGAGLISLLGADVVKVEPPGGATTRDWNQGAIYATVDQDKRSIVVDLKADDAAVVTETLVGGADAVIHNYRPETAGRLGLDFETLQGYNEEIISCVLTGFGEEGKYSDRIAYDPIAQAMSGIMNNTGEPDRKPSRVGCSLIDLGTGMFAAIAIQSALRYRDTHGTGQKVEVSLYDTAAAYMGYFYTQHDLTGHTPQRMGHMWEPVSPYGLFETKTDPVYIAIAQDHQWERLASEFGREEWIDDPRFNSPEARIEHRAEVFEEMEAEFAEYTREEIIERLEGKVAVGELRTVEEAAEDEFLYERGTLKRIAAPPGLETDKDKTVVSDIPIRFSEDVPPSEGELSLPGQDTTDILRDAGFGDDEIQNLLDDDVVSQHAG